MENFEEESFLIIVGLCSAIEPPYSFIPKELPSNPYRFYNDAIDSTVPLDL